MRIQDGPRRRRAAAFLVVLLLALAGSITANSLAGASTGSRTRAKLVLKRADPATVSGTGFKPRSRVRVVFVGARTFVRRPVANAQGAFTATFPTVADRCSGFSVSASQPGRATVMLRSPARPECAPASTP
jgi:hypothetical protein